MPRERPDLKYPIQFRIGRGLLTRVDKSAWNVGVSRNTWISEAIQARLRTGNGQPCRVTAAELMNERVALMVRLDELTLDLLNESTEDDGATRTIWIIDAMLAALAKKKG